MAASDPATLRKAILKTLAGVLRVSTLSEAIDHRGFFMMLNANYSVLYRDGTLYLDPLYRALAAKFPEAALVELFLRFEQALTQLGVPVCPPPAIAALPSEVRQAHAALDQDFEAEKTDEFVLAEGEVAARMSLPLSGAHTPQLLPPALRQEITQAAVNAVRQTPLGQHIHPGQFGFLVDSNFEQLCDGQRFDFTPILTGLRDIPGVQDRDIFPAVQLLRRSLRTMDIEVPEVPLKVADDEAVLIMHEVERSLQARGPRSQPSRPITGERPRPTTGELRSPTGELPGEAKELSPKKLQPIRWRPVLLGTILLVILAVGLSAWFGGQIRVDAYRSSVPLRAATVEGGAFTGQLSDVWWTIPPAERPARLKRFTAQIRDQGHLPNLQIWDARGQLVVINRGRRLEGSHRFLTHHP